MATSVNSSTSAPSSLSAKTGMAGLVSGLDTDSLVESLTSSNRAKIEKQQQSIQRLEWKQTSYRNVSKALKEFQSKYLDVLSSTNFRSTALYNSIKASTTSSKLAVSATSGAAAGTIKISNVTQLATSQTISSTSGVSKTLTGETDPNVGGLLADISAGDKSFLLKLDGKVRTVTLDAAFAAAVGDGSGFETAMQDKIDSVFGKKSDNSSIVEVALTGGKLGFSSSGSQLTVNALNTDTETLTKLGLTNGQTDRLTTTKTLADLSSSLRVPLTGSDFNFSINGKDFSFKSTDSLASVMSKVNAGGAGVAMAYSSITDKFSLTAIETGTGENISLTESDGNLLASLGLLGVGPGSQTEYGQNAELEINGIAVVRSSNNIEVNGVKIELKDKTAIGEELVINMSTDTKDLKETIKSFVTDYNNLLDMMNGLVKEKADKAYLPLTDAQKGEMNEKEIENWETKAKAGLLQNDSALKTITSKMQTMIYGSAVSGGISLFNMGITSSGYTENGKLKIDEEKLQTALETRGEEIKDLFTTEETGLANQLNSIIDSAAKTSGIKGTRGSLIELAGYESTLSNTENSITATITRSNKSITKLKEILKNQETYYWSKFSALETALQQLNTQSAMVTSFGSSS